MSKSTSERTVEQTVVFTLGEESYGIEIFRVNEIIRLCEITPIPQTQRHVKGLVNLRGKTVPVIDLHERLGLDEMTEADSARIIVLESDHGDVGVMVDSVREVVTFGPDDVEDAPTIGNETSAQFVRGVARQGDHLITLLDLDQALAA